MRPTSLTFQIPLVGTEPLITRTFKVSAKTTMYELHHIIQVVIGWTNSYEFRFNMGKYTFVISSDSNNLQHARLLDHNDQLSQLRPPLNP